MLLSTVHSVRCNYFYIWLLQWPKSWEVIERQTPALCTAPCEYIDFLNIFSPIFYSILVQLITNVVFVCWPDWRFQHRGIPYVSKDRHSRIEAIGNFLSENDHYDVVSLQEVWTEHDYQKIKKLAENVLPYAHYFYRCESHMRFEMGDEQIYVYFNFLVASLVQACAFYRNIRLWPHCFMHGRWMDMFIAFSTVTGLVAKALAFVKYWPMVILSTFTSHT